MERYDISNRSFIDVLIGKSKLIAISTFLAFVVSILIVIGLPKYYETTFSFLTLSSGSYDSYQILSPRGVSSGTYGGKEEISGLVSVFRSKSFKQDIVENAQLIDYFGVSNTKNPLQSAVKILDGNIKINVNKDDGLITIKVLDLDNKMSLRISEVIIENIQKRLLSEVKEKNKKILGLMEINIGKKKLFFDSLTNRLRSLRSQYKILDSKTQSEYLVKTILYKSNSGMSSSVSDYIAGIEEVRLLEIILEEEGVIFAEDQTKYLNLKNTFQSPLKSISITEEPYLTDSPNKPNSYVVILGVTFIAFIGTIIVLLIIFSTQKNPQASTERV